MGLPTGSLPEIIIVYKSLIENGGRYFCTVYTRELKEKWYKYGIHREQHIRERW